MTGEFDIIDRYFRPLTRGTPGALDLTDDTALLPARSGFEHVITTDAIVAGVHFLEDETPANVAARLCASNLSDLASMGAVPVGFTLATAWNRSTDTAFIEAFASGLGEWVDEYDFPLLGGDTVSTPGPSMFSLTAIGEVAAGTALRRNAARPGDTVYVSGTIGDGALGLLAAQDKLDGLADADIAYLCTRFRRPTPRISTGRALIGHAHACIDISDGLVQDLGHICAASGVSMRIDAEAVPLSEAAAHAVAGDHALFERALSGGDDYELALTASGTLPETDVPLVAIGEVEAAGEGVRVVDAGGKTLEFRHAGFDHFA